MAPPVGASDSRSAAQGGVEPAHDTTPLGLLAGAGGLPGEAVRRLSAEGAALVVFGFDGLTDRATSAELRWARLGELGLLRRALAAAGVERLLVVGRFPRSLLEQRASGAPPAVLAPDAEGLALLREIAGRDDEGLMVAVGRWLEQRGFRVCRQDELLPGMLAAAGVLGGRSPAPALAADLALGRRVVRAVGRAGVGQAVAVKDGCVVAVEAVEGTDAMIARAGRLAGRGVSIVKAARPGQDRRFDLPAVGPGTVAAMEEVGAVALAVEAGATLVVESGATFAAADRADIAVVGFRFDEADR